MKRIVGMMVGLLMAATMTQAQMPVLDFNSTSMMAGEYEQTAAVNDEYVQEVAMPALDISRLNAMSQEAMRVANEKAEKEAEEELQRQLRKARPITGGEDMPVGEGLLVLMALALGYFGARRLYVYREKQIIRDKHK